MIIYNRIWGIDMKSEKDDTIKITFDKNKTVQVKRGTTYLNISELSRIMKFSL